MTSEVPSPTRLQSGEALRTAVDAGSAIVVTQGSVSVQSPPAWFGETMFSTTTVLHEGEAHVFERGGWVEIAAASSAQLVSLPRAQKTPTRARAGSASPWLPILRWFRT